MITFGLDGKIHAHHRQPENHVATLFRLPLLNRAGQDNIHPNQQPETPFSNSIHNL
ncbi:hypothetical protein [Kingella sp. (in: b-proteobacteria)]|uniref:hypothetical protein n=1 Tax=Kingella sp. (in: b-proteobacteria) TaxID=2020713 RepID=UPI0026DB2248|nr:hypothetical protein [Kingella sp. (in: b-proteobacteria)]MDO4658357.1 hypothetical protein [Kingella sp. (in: b-proteobacteria)]